MTISNTQANSEILLSVFLSKKFWSKAKIFIQQKNVYILSIPGQDSCSGDSGGPLVWREYSDDPWYQIGVVSFGAVKCGSKDIPGVYTRVEAYLPWIERNLEAW